LQDAGYSARLPEPFATWARASWDSGTFHGRRWARLFPATFVQRVSHFAERLQRPELAVSAASTPEGSRVVFAGNDAQLRDVLFAAFDCADVESEQRVPARSALQRDFAAEVEFIEVDAAQARSLSRRGWLILPRWVEFEIDLLKPERELWDARKRESVRRIEREGFELEVCRDEAAAREFHDEMYAPTARIRHGPRAFVRRWGYVERAARRGHLVFVRQAGQRKAGLLLVPRGGSRSVDAWLFGVRDGVYAESRLAREAVYLHALRWARDRLGARGFGLTAGPPLLRDGLVRFKKRWGAQALPGARHGTAFAMRVHHGTPELAAVLEQKPLIGLSWESAAPRLCAPVPRLAHQPRVHSSPLPGVLVRELELAVAEELPERWDAYARAAAAY